MNVANMETKKQEMVHIRCMIRRDMPEVLVIEQLSFEFAWEEDDFLRCFRQCNCISMVAEYGEKVVGFMIYELHKGKLHILNFAVHPGWRRSSIGAQMVGKLVSKLAICRRWHITIYVRETNLQAQLFFSKQHFRALCVNRKFYNDTGEDAFLMEYRLAGASENNLFKLTNRISYLNDENWV